MTGQIDAKLRISAETAQAVGKVRELLKQIEQVNKTGKGGAPIVDAAALRPASRQLEVIRGQAGEIRSLLGNLFATVGVAAGLQAVTRMSDSYSGMTARLRNVTEGQAEFNQAMSAARTLSGQYQQGLEGVVRLATKTYGAIKPLGGTLEDATKTTEALLAALKADGAQAQESASAILQFSQALSSGVLRGEEFNAITEAAPSLLQALAEGLGKPGSELKKLGEEGKLTTDQIVIGLTRVLPKLRETADAIPPTIGGGFTVLNNAVTEFIGKAAQASGVARGLADLLKLAADNAGALVTVAAALGGVALLVGVGKVVGAIAGAIGAASAAGGVLTGLLAIIGGPVGLVAALGALAAAWLGLGAAKRRATEGSLEALRAERDEIEAQLAEARSQIGKSAFGNDFIRIQNLQNELARVKDRIDAITDAERERARFSRQAEQAGASAPDLRDPAGLKRLTDEYKLADEISRKFEDDRKQLIAASEKEVSFLRREGRDAEADALAAATDRRLKLIDKAERDALRKQAPVASRITQYKAAFDATLELQADAIAREKAANERAFEDGLRDAQAYLAERTLLEEEAFAADMARMQGELEQRRRVRDQNIRRASLAENPNEAEGAREAVFAETQAIARLEAEIERRKRDQAAAAAALLRDARQLGDELRRQAAEVERELATAQGQDLTIEQLRSQVLDRYKPQLDRIRQLGGDSAPLLKLVDVEATRLQLGQVEREFTRMQQDLAAREAEVQNRLSGGRVTNAEAESETLALRRQSIPVLDAIIQRMAALAVTPEDRQRIEQLRLQIGSMGDLRTELEKTARSAGINAITNALNDITTGAKSGKEALLDMVGGFARAMLDVLNRRLAEKLVDQFLKAVEGGGLGDLLSAGAKAVGSFFGFQFHTGGHTGRPTTRRQIDPAAAAAAIAYGPRFHSGLRSNELLAVLEDDETVLTAEQTKRVASRARGGLTFNSTVQVSGATGGDAELRRGAEDLEGRIRLVTEQWAAENARPGGFLFNLKGA